MIELLVASFTVSIYRTYLVFMHIDRVTYTISNFNYGPQIHCG